jgi:hypothetical protein
MRRGCWGVEQRSLARFPMRVETGQPMSGDELSLKMIHSFVFRLKQSVSAVQLSPPQRVHGPRPTAHCPLPALPSQPVPVHLPSLAQHTV